jgi:isochorismate synthase EntC
MKPHKGVIRLATQLQPTPIVSGKEAEEILKAINIKQPSEKIFECRTCSNLYKAIKKKGL